MALDDPRLEWVKNKISVALNIKNIETFNELLIREDGINEQVILNFLNSSTTETESTSLIFVNDPQTVKQTIPIQNLVPEPKPEPKTEEDEEGEEKDEKEKDEKEKKKPPPGPAKPAPMKFLEKSTITSIVIQDKLFVSRDRLPDVAVSCKVYGYLVRSCDKVIPTPNDIEEAELVLPAFLEIGVVNGSPLRMIDQVLSNVFLPMLSFGSQISGAEIGKEDVNEEDSIEGNIVRDESQIILNKFSSIVQRTMHQLEGDIKLEVPYLFDIDEKNDELAKKTRYIGKARVCLQQLAVSTYHRYRSTTEEDTTWKRSTGRD